MASIRSPREVDVHVGNRVRVLRNLRKMTQEALAHQLGITFQQVQKYEKGSNRISAGRLQHLADILKVPITSFFEGLDVKGKIDPTISRTNKFLATREGMRIAQTFPQLGKRAQQAILDLIKASGGR
ncbi:MAG TPA: helix-turn-helix transcriptional regulator [Xanthobacteraceae bacterium]|nr:helix-turn-helix transcriptional regulator [Xanthobacteraceae bacterium]